jgi:hypothetical protein
MIEYVKRLAGPFTAEGATNLPFGFKIFDPTDVFVAASTDPNVSSMALVYGKDYSVTMNADQDAVPGGTVVLNSPISSGQVVVIGSAVAYTQNTQLTNFSRFPPEIINESLDRIVVQIQQLVELTGRTISLPPTSSLTVSEFLDNLLNAAKDAANSADEAAQYARICEEIKQNIFIYSWDIPHVVDTLDDVEKYPYDGFFAVGGYGDPGHHGQDISNRVVKASGSTERRTLGERFSDVVNVRDFGAKGDGVHDDTEAIQAAINFASEKGRTVVMPGTGAAYVTGKSVIVRRGVSVLGDSHNGYAGGSNQSNAVFARAGTTVNPKHKNSAFILQEVGASIGGVQFVHDQPAPTGDSWTPIQYGYCIEAKASWHTIKDISVINGSHGIWLSQTPTAPGGTQVTIDNCRIGAFEVGLRHDSVTDTLAITRVNFGPSWQVDTPVVKKYRHEHTVGWELGHGSGTYADGLEFYRLKTAMRFRSLPNNVGYDTGARAGRFDNILFNLVNKAVELESANLITSVNFGTVYAQSTDDWNLNLGAETLFDIKSNNADFSFERLAVGTCGGRVFTVGAGTGGRVTISDLNVAAYSANSDGQSAFYVDAGAELQLGTYKITKTGRSGQYFSGPGASAVVTAAKRTKVFFPVFNAVTINGTGQAVTITTDDPAMPARDGCTQIRLRVNINIRTPAVGKAVVSFSGVSVNLDASSTGWKDVDSGWVDIPSSYRNKEVGRLTINAPSGTEATTGSCYAQWR